MPSFRLRTHLIVYCTAVTLLLTAAVIVLYSHLFKDHAMGSLTAYGKAITMNTSFAVADDLITENYAPLQEYVREFSSRANVDAIQIADNQWKTLAASEVRLLGSTMEEDARDTCVSEDQEVCVRIDSARGQLVITAPIAVGRTILGRTRVFLSIKPILAHLQEVQTNAAFTGLCFWIVAVLVGTFLAQRMSEPVQRFMQITDSITQGNFNVQIPRHKSVLELERFSETLQVMANTIASREQALQESEKKFRHLFQRALEGIFVADGNGVLLDVNPAFISILGGGTRESMLGRNLFAGIFENEETFSKFNELICAYGYVKEYELTLLKNDSTPAVASLTCHVVRGPDGVVTKYEGMIRDITEQKAAAQEISRMRNFLNNIIESMPSMLITLDNNSMVTQWNSAASQITGISSQQAIGRKVYDVAPVFSKYSAQVDASSRSRTPVKLQREHLADAEHLYNLTFFPLVSNGVSGVAIRLDDVTELEQMEHQLRQAQKMECIGTLAGGLAHDFNNVLAGILGNLSLLNYRFDTKPEGLSILEIRDYLNRMECSGQRAVDMVRQLLTLSRRQQTDLVPVDLNLSVKHVRKIGENTFDKSVEVVVRPANVPAYVLADTTEMEQVLLNLCINGVHAMTFMRGEATWGGTLTVVIEKVLADEVFRLKHPETTFNTYWKVSVSDTGVGMDSKTVSRIFDPFFTTKEQGKGTGLGLAMVYSIISQQQGFIEVYSELGLGSIFNVYLPVLAHGGTGRETGEKPDIAAGEGLVLVVDDDESVRGMAVEILRSVGYTVLSAGNGLEGVELFRQHQDRIRAVLLDMAMPVMSGRETYLEMKKINPDVKVLLASGFRKDDRVEEILSLGVKDFLQKPYTMAGLALAIQKVITA